jgi:hypothetical protein
LENLLDHRVIEQTLQIGSCFGALRSFGVDGIIEEHNELTISLDEVHKITLFMDFGKIFRFVVSAFGMVHVIRPKRVFAMFDKVFL